MSTHLSAAQCSEYCTLMKQFADVFSWEYSDLKTYDKNNIHHNIPLENETISFKKTLRHINTLLLPLIEKGIKKLLVAKIIVTLRRFGISVNPKKSQFALEEVKLPGHIVSVASVKIDLERVKEIQTLSVPRSKKDIQSFLGKINFVRRFIPNFAKLVKHITSTLKKGSEVKWTDAARRSFKDIKRAIMEAPTLISPYYSKEFHIFSFTSDNTLPAVLL
eukprot:PITA_17902